MTWTKLFLVLSIGWAGSAAALPACKIHPVTNHGSVIKVPGFTIKLFDPDSESDPQAWDTGLTVTNVAGQSCTFDESIITPTFYLAGDHILYSAVTPDSSRIVLNAVDLRSCASPWNSKVNDDPPHLVVNGGGFAFGHAETDILGNDCLPNNKG